MDSKMPESLNAFAPVPSASNRHDGWTPQRQREFIANLARLGLVGAAAKALGMSAKSAYALLKRAGETSEFAAAWNLAVREGRGHALDTSIERAIEGEAVPVFYGGRQVGERRRYDNRLLIAALRATAPRAGQTPAAGSAEAWDC